MVNLRHLAILISLIGALNLSASAELAESVSSPSNGSPVIIPLWNDKSPSFQSELPADAEVVENPGWISMVTYPELYVYPTEKPNGTALLMCPGGGYYGVAILHEGKEIAPILNEEGITVAVLKYRMPNGHKEVPAEDVFEALKILKENAVKWGINPDKIGIGGASAGGHLASTVATHPNPDYPKPSFVVLLYPVISMKEGLTHQGSKDALLGQNPSQEIVDFYSNELQVSPSTPPTFIAVSADDTVVPVENSIYFFNALKENNVPVALHVYPVGGHGWGTNSDFIYSEEWKAELKQWLKNL